MGDRKMNNKFMPILLGISMIFTLGVKHYGTQSEATKVMAADNKNVSYTLSSKNDITADDTFPFNVSYSGTWTWKDPQCRTTDSTATVTFSGNNTVAEITSIQIGCSSSSYANAGTASNDYTTSVSNSTVKISGNGSSTITWAPGAAVRLKNYTITYILAETKDSISLNDGDQSVTLTEGETYGSKILYASEGSGDESVKLSSGTDVASLTLDTTNTTISIAANKGITGTGVYKLVKGTTESTESITVNVNESTTPSINFDYANTGIDKTKMELLSNELYMIPYTTKNCGTSPTITFTSSDTSIGCYEYEGHLVIETPQNLIDDLAFTVSYSIKDGESEKLTGSLSFTAIAPSIALSTNELVVNEYGSLDVGLTLTGFDTSKVTITLDTGESTNYTASLSEDKSTITLMGLTECADDMLSIDVSDGTRKFSDTYTVTVSGAPKYDNDIYTKITSVDEIVDGKYLLVYEETVDDVTTYYAFNGKDEANGYNTNTTVASNGSFDTVKLNITKNSDGTYYFQINGGDNNGKYIDKDADNKGAEQNGLDFEVLTDSPKQTITFDDSYGLLIKGTGGSAIRFNTASGQKRFRYYKTSTYTNTSTGDIYKAVSLYKVDEANTTLGYANIFQSALSEPCNDVDADNKDSVSAVWTYLANRYNGMPSVVQQQLTSGDSADETVLTALARYDHIIQRYQLNDFMKRSNSSSRNQMIFNNDTDTAVTIIVVVTLLSVTSIGGYFFIRRRKHA